MAIRFSPGCKCCGCSGTFQFTILDCDGDPISGVLCEVYDGATLLASCTTGGAGICTTGTATTAASGPVTIKLTFPGGYVFTETVTWPCGNYSYTYNQPDCAGCLGTDDLLLSTPLGDVTLVYGAGGGGSWTGKIRSPVSLGVKQCLFQGTQFFNCNTGECDVEITFQLNCLGCSFQLTGGYMTFICPDTGNCASVDVCAQTPVCYYAPGTIPTCPNPPGSNGIKAGVFGLNPCACSDDDFIDVVDGMCEDSGLVLSFTLNLPAFGGSLLCEVSR